MLAAGLLVGGCVVSQPPPAATPSPASTPVASAPAGSSELPKTPAPAKATAKAPPSAAKSAAPPPKQAAASPATARPPKAPALDLKSLEARLKGSGAIGVLTKLSLKNQVDDLVARFRAFHDGRRPPTLAELRPAYELLLMKVLSLLQDKDTALASDIDASRDAIWAVLADRSKLAQ